MLKKGKKEKKKENIVSVVDLIDIQIQNYYREKKVKYQTIQEMVFYCTPLGMIRGTLTCFINDIKNIELPGGIIFFYPSLTDENNVELFKTTAS